MNKLHRPIKTEEKLLRCTSVSHVIVFNYHNPQHQSLTSLSYVITNHNRLSRHCVKLLQSTSVSHVIVLIYYNPHVSHVIVLSHFNPHQSPTSLC
jgi:predicted secreted protein